VRLNRLFVAAAAALSVVLAACGSGGGGVTDPTDGSTQTDEPTQSETAADQPEHGGTLTYLASRLGVGVDPTAPPNLNPGNQSGYFFLAIYDYLVIETPDGYAPGLAESLESDDGINWTMKLKSGVEFSDGTPFDAEAVKYNWERHDEAGKTGFALMQQIESVTVVDDLTLDIVLKAPSAVFPALVAFRLNAIGSPTAFEEDPDGLPVGAGPFKIESWVPDGELVLVRNENYWNAPLPYLDKLVFLPVADTSQALAAVTTGDADGFYGTNYDISDRSEQAGLEVLHWVPTGGPNILFNTSAPPLDDVRVRQALVLAMNSQGFSDTIERGLSPVPTTIFSEESPFHNPAITLPEHDPAAAQALIDEVVAETGGPIKVEFATAPGPSATWAEYFQSQVMSDVENLEISIVVAEGSTYVSDIIAGKFQAFNYALNISDPEPNFADTFGVDGGNMVRYEDAEFQDAINVGKTSVDLEERKAAYDTIQQIMIDQALGKFFARSTKPSIHDPARVGGIEMVGLGAPLFHSAYIVR